MGMTTSDGMTILMVFVGVIIAATFIASIGTDIVGITETTDTVNGTFTLCSTVNCTIDITGRELVAGSTSSFTNATGTQSGAITRFALTEGFGSSGLTSIQVLLNDTAFDEAYGGVTINITYSYEPDGFVDGGAGSITTLILIFAALAIVIFTLISFMKTGSLGVLMKHGVKGR